MEAEAQEAIDEVREVTARLEALRAEVKQLMTQRDKAALRAYENGVMWSELAREARVSGAALVKVLDRARKSSD